MLDIITSIVIVVLLSRLNVEKTIKQEQEEIKARHETSGAADAPAVTTKGG